MLTLDHLKNCPQSIPKLAEIWCEALGQWFPSISLEEVQLLLQQELEKDWPITYVAFWDRIPVGFCTLELDSGIRPDLTPWIGDCVVASNYRSQGIGKMLLQAATHKALELGFSAVFLFTFDFNLKRYYERFGWKVMGEESFQGDPVLLMRRDLRPERPSVKD